MLLSGTGSREGITNVQRKEYCFLISFRFKKCTTRLTNTWDKPPYWCWCFQNNVHHWVSVAHAGLLYCPQFLAGLIPSEFLLWAHRHRHAFGSFSSCGAACFLALRVPIGTDCEAAVGLQRAAIGLALSCAQPGVSWLTVQHRVLSEFMGSIPRWCEDPVDMIC